MKRGLSWLLLFFSAVICKLVSISDFYLLIACVTLSHPKIMLYIKKYTHLHTFYNNLWFCQCPLRLLAQSPLYLLLGQPYSKGRPEPISLSAEKSTRGTIKLLEKYRSWLRRFPWFSAREQLTRGGSRRWGCVPKSLAEHEAELFEVLSRSWGSSYSSPASMRNNRQTIVHRGLRIASWSGAERTLQTVLLK